MEWVPWIGSMLMVFICGWAVGWHMREFRVLKSQERLWQMRELHDKQLSEATERCVDRIRLLGGSNWAHPDIVSERHDAALRSLESLVRVAQWWPERVDL